MISQGPKGMPISYFCHSMFQAKAHLGVDMYSRANSSIEHESLDTKRVYCYSALTCIDFCYDGLAGAGGRVWC